MRNAVLILNDGSEFHGQSFGYEGGTSGEVVFCTAMTGYPESLTDPSYAGQILVMTYPLTGNYGVPSSETWESGRIHAKALITADYSMMYSHWSALESLGSWLQREHVPGITGIDTRRLTKKLREHGYDVQTSECSPNSVEAALAAGGFSLMACVSPVYEEFDIPKVNAIGMLTGLSEQQVIDDCLAILDGEN